MDTETPIPEWKIKETTIDMGRGTLAVGVPVDPLMRSAPDLLEACKRALPQVERFHCYDPNGETIENPVIGLLRSAIAKAELK